MPGRKSKKNLRIAGPESTVRIEVRVLFSSRGCSHPGLELYHWFPTCQVMDVKLLKCLCPCEQQTGNGELLSGTASEKQRSSSGTGLKAAGSATKLPFHALKLFIAPTSPPPSSSLKPAWRQQVQLPNCPSTHSKTLHSSSYITTTIIITETSRRQACIACCHSPPCSPFS